MIFNNYIKNINIMLSDMKGDKGFLEFSKNNYWCWLLDFAWGKQRFCLAPLPKFNSKIKESPN